MPRGAVCPTCRLAPRAPRALPTPPPPVLLSRRWAVPPTSTPAPPLPGARCPGPDPPLSRRRAVFAFQGAPLGVCGTGLEARGCGREPRPGWLPELQSSQLLKKEKGREPGTAAKRGLAGRPPRRGPAPFQPSVGENAACGSALRGDRAASVALSFTLERTACSAQPDTGQGRDRGPGGQGAPSVAPTGPGRHRRAPPAGRHPC